MKKVNYVFISKQVAVVYDNVCWYGHVLRRVDGHVLKMELGFEFDEQKTKGRLKRTW